MAKSHMDVGLALVLTVALELFSPMTAYAVSFTFTQIASSITFDSLGPASSISDDGAISFQASRIIGPSTVLGVYKGNGTSLLTISELSSLAGSPSINNFGLVAFTSNEGGPTGRNILTGDGGTLSTVISSTTSLFQFGGPLINDSGVVAFRARTDLGGSGKGIFTVDSGGVTTIATTRDEDPASPFTVLGDIAFNNQGEVAFRGDQFGGPSGIFVGDGTGITIVADTTGVFSGFGAGPAINDSGSVAVLGGLDVGGEGIFILHSNNTTLVADNSDEISSFAAAPAINNLGKVAFIAHLDAGGAGIFTGADLLDKVVMTGDDLLGSEITDLAFFSPAFNDVGQIAFRATLADGRMVLVRADPLAVPEPTTLALLSIGLAGIGMSRRRRVPKH